MSEGFRERTGESSDVSTQSLVRCFSVSVLYDCALDENVRDDEMHIVRYWLLYVVPPQSPSWRVSSLVECVALQYPVGLVGMLWYSSGWSLELKGLSSLHASWAFLRRGGC